jgi:hypothetical protein
MPIYVSVCLQQELLSLFTDLSVVWNIVTICSMGLSPRKSVVKSVHYASYIAICEQLCKTCNSVIETHHLQLDNTTNHSRQGGVDQQQYAYDPYRRTLILRVGNRKTSHVSKQQLCAGIAPERKFAFLSKQCENQVATVGVHLQRHSYDRHLKSVLGVDDKTQRASPRLLAK